MADLLARQIDGITALVTVLTSVWVRNSRKYFSTPAPPKCMQVRVIQHHRSDRHPRRACAIETSPTQAISPRPLATARRVAGDQQCRRHAGAPFVSAPDMSAARTEMETNYFGTLAMAGAFAPAPAAAGGGALVNMLSVVSWFASPFLTPPIARPSPPSGR